MTAHRVSPSAGRAAPCRVLPALQAMIAGQSSVRKVRFGSKPEKLDASTCFPLCPRKRTLRDALGVRKVPNPEVAVPSIRGSFHLLRAAPSRVDSLNSTTSACRRTEPKGDMG